MRGKYQRRLLVPALVVGALTLGPGRAVRVQDAPQPTFKSGVELVALDVTVVDRNGRPVQGLGPEAFQVTIDGRPRRVA